MLSLLAAWCVLAAISLPAGAALIVLTGWPRSLNRPEDRLLVTVWTGLLVFGSLAMATALLVPLRPWLLPAPVLLLLAPPVRRVLAECRPRRRILVMIALIAIGMSRLSSGSGTLYDSDLYHTQLTSWMAHYGLPPGLGLLHYRMGFSSSWLALTALFDHGFLEHRMTNAVTGFAIVLLLALFTVALERAGRREANREDGYTLAAIPVLLALSGAQVFIQSASPNFGAAAAITLTGWLLLEGTSGLALVLAGGTASVKLSAAPAVAAALGRVRPAVLAAAAAVTVPLLLANYQTTGCPAFPVAVFCRETPSSLTAGSARRTMTESMDYGRNGTDPYRGPLAFAGWFQRWAVDGLNPYGLSLAAVALAVVVWGKVWNRALALSVGTAAYYFVTAPDLRFGLGPLAILCGCAGMVVLPKLWFPRMGAIAWASVIAAFIFVADEVWEAKRVDPNRSSRAAESRLVVPAANAYDGGPPRRFTQFGIEISMPREGDRCGSLAIPCTPYPVDPTMGLCDASKGFGGGFCVQRRSAGLGGFP